MTANSVSTSTSDSSSPANYSTVEDTWRHQINRLKTDQTVSPSRIMRDLSVSTRELALQALMDLSRDRLIASGIATSRLRRDMDFGDYKGVHTLSFLTKAILKKVVKDIPYLYPDFIVEDFSGRTKQTGISMVLEDSPAVRKYLENLILIANTTTLPIQVTYEVCPLREDYCRRQMLSPKVLSKIEEASTDRRPSTLKPCYSEITALYVRLRIDAGGINELASELIRGPSATRESKFLPSYLKFPRGVPYNSRSITPYSPLFLHLDECMSILKTLERKSLCYREFLNEASLLETQQSLL